MREVQSTGGKEAGGKQWNTKSPGLFFAVHKAHSFLLHIFPAEMASLVELHLFPIPQEHQLPVGGRAHNMEQQVFDPAILVLDVQEGKIQWLHETNGQRERTIHVKTRSMCSAWKTWIQRTGLVIHTSGVWGHFKKIGL